VRITADTNILVRAIIEDEPDQSRLAQDILARAGLVALPLPVLCELVWVLGQGYRIPAADIAAMLRRLIDSATVAVNRPAAEAGLAMLTEGGDFADGVIAYEGRVLGAGSFVSFDRLAVRLLEARGTKALVPGLPAFHRAADQPSPPGGPFWLPDPQAFRPIGLGLPHRYFPRVDMRVRDVNLARLR